jgi:hypothetical protein
MEASCHSFVTTVVVVVTVVVAIVAIVDAAISNSSRTSCVTCSMSPWASNRAKIREERLVCKDRVRRMTLEVVP